LQITAEYDGDRILKVGQHLAKLGEVYGSCFFDSRVYIHIGLLYYTMYSLKHHTMALSRDHTSAKTADPATLLLLNNCRIKQTCCAPCAVWLGAQVPSLAPQKHHLYIYLVYWLGLTALYKYVYYYYYYYLST